VTGIPEDNLINFGHKHVDTRRTASRRDYKFGSRMVSKLPADAVGVIDRGFAGLNNL
jgi:putative transposase